MRVYVAGPISLGDLGENLRRGLEAANKLVAAGHHPFLPHLSIYWNLAAPPGPETHDFWLWYDFEWLRQCDAIVRLPGESVGADREVAEAERCGIMVYRSVEELVRYNRIH